MLPYTKARKLADTWVELITDGACTIVKVEDKPYGWLFYYCEKESAPNERPAQIGGNAPIIVDRIDGEIRVTGTAHPVEHYIEEYEATLPEPRLQMAPERHS